MHSFRAERSSFRGSRSWDGRFGVRRGRAVGFRRHCFNCGWRNGYPLYGFYDPYWDYWWWDRPSYDENAARERADAAEMNRENLEEQRMLREQEQDLYARPASEVRAEERARAEPSTLLVFRDQHQREIQNYAISDGILWNFTAQRTERIPLAILDIPATTRANDDRGVEFRVPGSSPGQ